MPAVWKKLQAHGLGWLTRRVVREILRPKMGGVPIINPLRFLLYFLFIKPVHFLASCFHKEADPAFYFVYDLDVEPVTYDYFWSLATAQAQRQALGLKRLVILIVPGRVQGLRREDQIYNQYIDENKRRWRLTALFLPSAGLLPTPTSLLFCYSRQEAGQVIKNQPGLRIYPPRYNITFPLTSLKNEYTKTESFMSLRASAQSKRYVEKWLKQKAAGQKVIVITLRQYDYVPERNNNIPEWTKFVSTLDKKEYFVVFVLDTEKVGEGLPEELSGFTYYEPASWNLELRMALYESAYLNMGVNNGPMALCWLNAKCRYLCFKIATCGVEAAEASNITKRYDFEEGATPPFANAFQKWVWEEDTAEVLEREFYTLCKSLSRLEKQSYDFVDLCENDRLEKITN